MRALSFLLLGCLDLPRLSLVDIRICLLMEEEEDIMDIDHRLERIQGDRRLERFRCHLRGELVPDLLE